ncbi:hypothetical protein [Paenibacillus segetis]|uniref:Uncharacterized protein n=1 Tax=Paenibacillus segetis TaxID=1325360 RepID=A0ABQ1Y2J8_9BACL|nr:hypothetical protein [Paenibacillus segetis]GGH09633.1 hypothetical protein GCM10008013_00770 [Paenibacillus segetis]
MTHAFIIEPTTYNAFENEEALIDKCKEWGLLSDKAVKAKAFFYRGNGVNLPCDIVGYVDNITAVIELDNKQKHCIHPSYLKEMQAANYGQKTSNMAEESISIESDNVELEGIKEEAIPPVEAKTQLPELDKPESKESSITDIVDISEAPESPEPPKTKPKKEKKQKLQLPEEKVKMTAIVQEFTTVPNHFSDNDDEVVIYEAVTIIEPELEVGEAWSSHSATLKKHELAIGDKITFEAKIVAKKLTKYPVPYKINNPAKIQKVES